MQRSYSEGPQFRESLFRLLDGVFEDLSDRVVQQEAVGLDWEGASTPFVDTDGDRFVAHVGVIELDLVMDGQPIRVGSMHAVATDPEYRRQGRCRRLVEEALAFCDARYQTVELATELEGVYVGHGFRRISESRFIDDRPGGGASARKSRILNLLMPKDRELLLELLSTRAPVSRRLGVVRDSTAFLFASASRPLRYIPDLNCVVFGELKENRVLELWDVIAPSMPTLADLVAYLPERWRRLEVYFTPDQLDAELETEAHVLDTDGPDLLMVRGPYPSGPLMLPRTART